MSTHIRSFFFFFFIPYECTLSSKKENSPGGNVPLILLSTIDKYQPRLPLPPIRIIALLIIHETWYGLRDVGTTTTTATATMSKV